MGTNRESGGGKARMKWVLLLYPKEWRREFGPEMEALLDRAKLSKLQIADLVIHAVLERLIRCTSAFPAVAVAGAIAYLNIFAHEVQWTAGALVLACGATSLWRTQGWPIKTLGFAAVVPISTLYVYQQHTLGHHHPLYETSIALIPAFFGAGLGLLLKQCKAIVE